MGSETMQGFPLSPQQERLWHLLEGGANPAYRSQCALKIEGDLDRDALRQALRTVVAEHEILRTAFRSLPGMSLPLQVVCEPGPLTLEEVDLTSLDPGRKDAGVAHLFASTGALSFDLAGGSVLRTALLRLDSREHALLLSLPALCADPATLDHLAVEIARTYARLRAVGPEGGEEDEAPLQYADISEWQSQLLEEEDDAGGVDRWRRYWIEREIPAHLQQRLPFENGAGGTSPFELAAVPVRLEPELAAALEGLLGAWGVPPAGLFLACWQILLWRSTGRPDLLVGVLHDGRRYEELQGTLGPLARYLPIHTRLSGESGLREVVAEALRATEDAARRQERFSWRHVHDRGADAGGSAYFPFCFAVREPWEHTSAGLRLTRARYDGSIDRFKLELDCETRSGELRLELRFDRRLFHHESIEILAERLRTLLRGLIARPEAPIAELEIVGEGERRLLLSTAISPGAPGRSEACLHRLFEEQVERTPGRTALVARGTELSFADLNRDANRLAHHLRFLGVGPETPVALCFERSPEMVVAILGVLKAGGSWVPLDPSHPPERLSFIVADTGAPVLLTQSRLRASLPRTGALMVCLDAEAEEIDRQPDTNPAGVALPGSLAYAIYTSGSTGRPKGVLIEHRAPASLLDAIELAVLAHHLREPLRVSLNAPLAFDASVQQLVLMAAGHTLCVIPEEVRTDGPALLAFLREQAVDLFDCTPSQLRILLSAGLIGAPGPVPEIVLTAGEAIDEATWSLLRSSSRPVFYNLYGPTECTVDATVCRIDPSAGAVPTIGHPLAGYEAYVLDSRLHLAPMGVPGELCIGGVGLARGYVGRPEATAERFVPHPFGSRPGLRLYRTGDLARRLPDGRHEFLGRIDHQVKIRGYRIEPGEIEMALGEHPWVREAMVVVRSEGGEPSLAAYVLPGEAAPAGFAGAHGELHRFLRQRLPVYMIPASFVALAAFPLTPNGKVDRRALAAMAPPADRRAAGRSGPRTAPRSSAEALLAGIWRDLLRIEDIGVEDNFFELGGDSILSIQVISRAARAGLRLTARQIFEHQTISGLAAVAEEITDLRTEAGLATGLVPLTPIQRELLDRNLPDPWHFNQSMLLQVGRFQGERSLEPSVLYRACTALLAHHDALRMRFEPPGPERSAWRQVNEEVSPQPPFTRIDMSALPAERWKEALESAAARLQASLLPSAGRLVRIALFTLGGGEADRLLWIVHHLVVDGVSWRILLEDLETACRQLSRGEPVELPRKTTSFRTWAERLASHALSAEVETQGRYWLERLEQLDRPVPVLPVDLTAGDDLVGASSSVTVSLDPEETRLLLSEVPRAYRTQINEVLLTALVEAFAGWTGERCLLLELEGHGREELFPDLTVASTVGWFTSVFPVLLDLRDASSPGEALRTAKEQLRSVPGRGIAFGLLRYLGEGEVAAAVRALPRAGLVFNYLGQLDAAAAEDRLFARARESAGEVRSRRQPRPYLLEINAAVSGQRLWLSWGFGGNRHRRATIERLAGSYLEALRSILAHCLSSEAGGYTPSDFPLAQLGTRELDRLLGARKGIEDLYPLSSLQEGILLHSLLTPGSGVYVGQLACTLRGDLELSTFQEACRRVVEHHPVLRTSFLWEGLDRPLQALHGRVHVEVESRDLREVEPAEQERLFQELLDSDRARGFDLSRPPLMRWILVRTAENEHRLVWSHHHVALDGWSFSAISADLLACYEALRAGREPRLSQRASYRSYIAWLEARDPAQSEAYWRRALAGWTGPTPLGVDRPAAPGAPRGSRSRQLRFSAAESAALQEWARRHQLTLSSLTQGVWGLLLGHYSSREDVVFGATLSGRSADLPGIESIVGLFINTLPVRVRIPSDARLAPWLREQQQRLLELLQHEHTPLVRVHGWSEVPRGTSLFESLLIFENYPRDASLRQGESSLGVREARVLEQTNYPLVVMVGPGTELFVRIDHDLARLDEATVDRMLGHFRLLLGGVAATEEGDGCDVWDLPLLAEQERKQLLVEWNDSAVEEHAGRCVHELLAEQALRTPESIAVAGPGGSLTYRELDERAGRLAHHLRRLGVGPEVLVALGAERSVDLLVGVLGILKAGGAYVPLDPSHPRERLAMILEDARPAVLLTQEALLPRLPHLPEGAIQVVCLDALPAGGAPIVRGSVPPSAGPQSLAYVLFTSGSTGRPKGVQICHGALANFLLSVRRAPGLSDRDVLLAVTTLSFDIAALELLLPLLTGARVELASREETADGALLAERLSRSEATVMQATPATWRMLFAAGWPGDPRLRALCGGEALPADLAGRLLSCTAGLWNLYGPTEATVWSLVREVAAAEAPVLLGGLVDNTTAHVVDRRLQPVPVGVAGELVLGGVSLARGYLGRPDLTAEKFLPDPWRGEPGARLYRTGDLARRRPDGLIEFLGRIDHQVKVRGFRIEPGEIAAALGTHPQVREAVVAARGGGEETRLISYVVPEGESSPATAELRRFLAELLPDYMVPSAFVFLKALPLTPSRKVDLRALPEPDWRSGEGETIAPRTPAEELLAGIWSQVLGLDRRGVRVGIRDSFFDLGGHSLLATQVISRVRRVFGVDLPLRTLFEAPTVEGMAARLGAAQSAGQRVAPLIERRMEAGDPPLSFAQERLWFLDRLQPGSAHYNMPTAARIAGPLDVGVLGGSLDEIVRRHEVLRAAFPSGAQGEAAQVVAPVLRTPLPLADLRSLPAVHREAEARRLARAEARQPFDLATGPLLRATLLRLDDEEHALLVTLHHVVFDGWSQGIFTRELVEIYRAFSERRPHTLPDLPLQYADFARWQREWLTGEVLDTQIAWWKGQLAGAPGILELPLDHPRPAVQTFRGDVRPFALPAGLSRAVAELGARRDSTLFMTLLAAFSVLLHRLSGQPRINLGSPIANRTRAELEGLIGLFANTLVFSTDLAGAPRFSDLLARVREMALGAYDHQDLPFERLVDELGLVRSLSTTPLFQTVLVLQNAPGERESPGERLRLRPLEVDYGTAKFDLNVWMAEADGRLVGGCEHNTDLFDPVTIERWLGAFERLLAGIVARPETRIGDLPLLAEAERHQLITEWSGPGEVHRPERGLHELFAEQAARTGDSVAVVGEGESLTYAELQRRANFLARRLLALGILPGDRVGLCLERSPRLAVGILGILAAGGAYVPLDPSYPRERLAFLLEDSRASLLVAETATLESLPQQAGEVVLLDRLLVEEVAVDAPARLPLVGPDASAYVIYTSGSTGRPKGVVVTHGQVVRLFAATAHWFGFGAGDVWTLFHSFAFDFSVWELWGALLHGGRLVVVPYTASRSPAELREILVRERVTVLNQTPSAFRSLIEADGEREPGELALRWVIFGGEALDPRSLAPWWERHGERGPALVNMYGITETTVHVTWRRLGEEDVKGHRGSVIGQPIPDLRLFVLDPRGEPVHPGVAGEIHVGGAGLALGYLERHALTAERFVPDPFGGGAGERLYRSGDLGRWRVPGELEYLGRLDQQVKVRGFRIELGEIEAALRQHPGLREVAVVARDEGGDRRLVAYVVASGGPLTPVEELRRHLLDRLPEHMVPAVFVELAGLPLTTNGKLDRAALPDPGAVRPALEEGYAAPRTPEEEVLCGIWSQVLGIETIGIRDNFFALGGDSILSLRVVALAGERGLPLSLADLFLHQTVEELAALSRESGISLEEGSGKRRPVEPFSLVAPQDLARLPQDLEDAYPLASLQAGMLYHMALTPEDPLYHNVNSWQIRGRFEPAAFREAVRRVVARHPVLRTSFDLQSYGEPLQLVHREAVLPIEVEDLRHLTPAEQEREIGELIARERRRPFDLLRPPQLRFHVGLRSADTFQLTLTENHAILDGWSLHSTLEEIFSLHLALLDGENPPPPPPIPRTYREYVHLERQALASPEAASFWNELLSDAPVTELPRWPSPPRPKGFRVRISRTSVPPGVFQGLQRLSRQAAVPLKSVFLAAHLEVLRQVGGSSDVVTGVVSNGRLEEAGGDAVRGLFLNTLPFRLDVAGGSWVELVRRTFARERELLAYRRYPLAAVQRRRGDRALFEIAFNYVHFHVVQGIVRTGGLQVLDSQGVEGTNFRLTTHFMQDPVAAQLDLQLEFDAWSIPRAQIEALAGRYERVLAAMAADPETREGAGAFLTEAERHQILREWNDTADALPSYRTLAEPFEARAALAPEAVALVTPEGEMTYGDLDRAANRVARYLRAQGAGPGALVGLCLERSAGMAVALLAILKAGAAYVPLDPAYPAERLAVLAEGLPWLLTEERFAAKLPGQATVVRLDTDREAIERQSGESLDSGAGPDDLAYVVYTSGSTGRPKGVMIDHRGALNTLIDINRRFAVTPEDRVLALSSLSFDLSVYDILGLLAVGGAVVMPPASAQRDPACWADLAVRHRVTIWNSVPALMEMLVEHAAGRGEAVPAPLRLVLLSGDWIPVGLPRRIRDLFGESTRVISLGGATEASIWSILYPIESVDPSWTSIPYGRPMSNQSFLVLDEDLEPKPVGVPGHLHIGGIGLALGYLHDEEKTRASFLVHPRSGERLYRTGDLGRYLPDGTIEFLGRVDHQVKVRGFRIELGEIESVLAQHPDVGEAVAVVREDIPGERRLAACVVPAPQKVPEGGELIAFLAERLPAHMVPAAVLCLEALPLTENGKVDRGALVRMPLAEASRQDFVAPRTPFEELLGEIFAALLQRERVGVHDSFFDLGGHSLLATQLVSRIRESLGIELPLREIFEAPTVAELAAVLGRRAHGEETPVIPIAPLPREGDLPLSFSQQRFWFLQQLARKSSAFNLASGLRLSGRLDIAALAASLGALCRRHEALRTSFLEVEGLPVQRINAPAPRDLPVVDLGGLEGARQEAELRRLADEEANRPFDLACGSLFRTVLLRLQVDEHVILLTLHHIVGDGWSLGVLGRDLGNLYDAFAHGRPPRLPDLPIQYADFAQWQRSWLSGERLERQLAYWREKLGGTLPLLTLPMQRERPARSRFRGGSQLLRLPAPVRETLRDLGRQEGATLFMTLLAAFKSLLHLYTGQEDLIVGTNVANRDRGEIEGIIGFFVNNLALRTDLSGAPTFRQLLGRVRDVVLGAFAHRDVPIEKIIEDLQPERYGSHAPLFQVMLVFQGFPIEGRESPGVRMSALALPHRTANFDLTVMLSESAEGISGSILYDMDLFDAAPIARMAEHFTALLAEIAEDPDRKLTAFPFDRAAEGRRLVSAFGEDF